MKRKWKYGKQRAVYSLQVTVRAAGFLWPAGQSLVLTFLFITCSCKNQEVPPVNSSYPDLDGLVQPVSRTIISNVKSIFPVQKEISPIINAVGIISYDPGLVNNISARFSGRIEKLYVRYNFQELKKGQQLMDVYSPAVLSEQQNLIYLSSSSTEKSLITSSEQKLKLLGLTGEQIRQIETTKQPINPLPVYSPYSGHIHDTGAGTGTSSSGSALSEGMLSMNSPSSAGSPLQIENLPPSSTSALSLKEGMYIQSEQLLFAVYDVSKVWAVLNVFPKDAALIKVGDKVSISKETNPQDSIQAAINYIEPITSGNASSIRIRVYLQNAEEFHLRIGVLLSATITTSAIDGLWLPRSAIVDLGQEQVVFLKSENHFITKEIQTGITVDSLVQVISGLNGKQQVAANAQYLVDSESFIQTSDDENK